MPLKSQSENALPIKDIAGRKENYRHFSQEKLNKRNTDSVLNSAALITM